MPKHSDSGGTGEATTVLTPTEIGAVIASTAWGFKEKDWTQFLDVAIAVCLAESGGKPANIGGPNSNGTMDYGLWQINSIHAKEFSGNSDAGLNAWDHRLEPVPNTLMAKKIYTDAGGWS